ncbi:centromere protein R [Salminus brasiliensis]|uniref:centromere protein R n=1 Tax=Salminus brasiliensis TaxID=930266 RepID=UPI003B838698
MPVKRNLLGGKENTPSKRPNQNKVYSPVTGTVPMSPASKTQAGNSKTSGKTVSSLGRKEPKTEEERMTFYRSKVEGSVEALMKTRKQLETLMPIEGSSELRRVLLMSPADLHTELKRHKELTSKVGSCVNAAQRHEDCLQGRTQTGSSYEFLKEILSG